MPDLLDSGMPAEREAEANITITERLERKVTCMRKDGKLDQDEACGKCRRCKRRASMKLWRERNQDGN